MANIYRDKHRNKYRNNASPWTLIKHQWFKNILHYLFQSISGNTDGL